MRRKLRASLPTNSEGFNPRTRTGCDADTCYYALTHQEFQPTHPHGVRPPSLCFFQCLDCFNPRTRTGCDRAPDRPHAPAGRFQPTHPHGVRRLCPKCHERMHEFQPTHPHGVRPFFGLMSVLVACFNPRTRTGCDSEPFGGITNRFHVSTHAPARGATLQWQNCRTLPVGFNPRTRTGCDGTDSCPYSGHPAFQPTHPHGVRPKIRRSSSA